MSDTPHRDAKLVEYLNEAYAKEKQLEISLQAHADVTTDEAYAKRLLEHLKETRSHAKKLSRRIEQLGGTPTTGPAVLPDPLTKTAEKVSGTIGKAKAVAQDGLQAVRRAGEQERMLHNARIEFADEAQEIANYMVIDSLATAVGDRQTAKVAREIRSDEERMQSFLGKLLPTLAANVSHDEVPISEIGSR